MRIWLTYLRTRVNLFELVQHYDQAPAHMRYDEAKQGVRPNHTSIVIDPALTNIEEHLQQFTLDMCPRQFLDEL